MTKKGFSKFMESTIAEVTAQAAAAGVTELDPNSVRDVIAVQFQAKRPEVVAKTLALLGVNVSAH